MPEEAQPMILKHEEGGYRHYLGGRPVHAGTQLRLLLQGKWVWARYESHGAEGYLHLAGDRVLRLTPDLPLRWPATYER